MIGLMIVNGNVVNLSRRYVEGHRLTATEAAAINARYSREPVCAHDHATTDESGNVVCSLCGEYLS
jgi:hypothetical protein